MIPVVEEILRRRGFTGSIDARGEALAAIQRRRKSHEDYSLALIGALGTMASDLPPLDPEVQPEVIDAIRRQYPQTYGPLSDAEIVERIGDLSPESLNGLVNGVKGKLLEMKVVEQLNDGAALGPLKLAPGQHADLASSATQPGYDIIIRNADGSVATELSAKCSADVNYVLDTLERYPEYQIVGSTELAAQHPEVIDAGLSDSDLSEVVSESLEAAGDVGNALDVVGDILPGLPLMVVIGKHGIPLIMGRTTFENALTAALPQLIEAGVFTGLGFLLASLDMGFFSIPVMLGARWLWKRLKERWEALDFMQKARETLLRTLCETPRFGMQLD